MYSGVYRYVLFGLLLPFSVKYCNAFHQCRFEDNEVVENE